MNTLIVEDEFTSRLLLQKILEPYGPAHIAVDGFEATKAVYQALEANEPYDLICLDIMMPGMDGHAALEHIRRQEETRGIPPSDRAKVVMTTALDDLKNVSSAYAGLCDAYLVKPIRKTGLLDELRKLGLLP